MSESILLDHLNPWWADARARSLGPAAASRARREAFERIWRSVADGDARQRAQVILGARQVGKTTLLRQVLDQALDRGLYPPARITYVDFTDDRFARVPSIREVLDSWEQRPDPSLPRLLLFDEITHAPNWALTLKALVDANRNGTAADAILATDSSASLLHKGAAEHLEGRVDSTILTGLTYAEFIALSKPPAETRDDFRARTVAFQRYLSVGGYPEHRLEDDPARARARIRSDVIEKAIYRDLGREGIDLDRARRLFVYLVRDSGAILNAAERARDLSVEGEKAPDARSVQDWVRALEQASLVASLPPWTSGAKRDKAGTQLKARPKIYAADHGLVTAFDPSSDPRKREQVDEKLLETAVFTHLRAIRNQAQDLRVGYLRESAGGEIDFVVEVGGRRIAIEVTHSRRVGRKLSKAGPMALDAGLDRLLIVHMGPTERRSAESIALNAEEFLLDPLTCLQE